MERQGVVNVLWLVIGNAALCNAGPEDCATDTTMWCVFGVLMCTVTVYASTLVITIRQRSRLCKILEEAHLELETEADESDQTRAAGRSGNPKAGSTCEIDGAEVMVLNDSASDRMAEQNDDYMSMESVQGRNNDSPDYVITDPTPEGGCAVAMHDDSEYMIMNDLPERSDDSSDYVMPATKQVTKDSVDSSGTSNKQQESKEETESGYVIPVASTTVKTNKTTRKVVIGKATVGKVDIAQELATDEGIDYRTLSNDVPNNAEELREHVYCDPNNRYSWKDFQF